MGRRLALVLAGAVWVACTTKKPSSPDASTAAADLRYPPAEGVPGCQLYGTPRDVGRVPLVLAEMSGLAASTRHEGVLWTHNDSGNAFQVFAIDASGRVLATLTLTGVEPKDLAGLDLEDIAVGPCASGEARSCLYLADTGDNFERRKQVRIFRFPEPEQVADATLPVETLPFVYPDRPHDAESLVLEPRTARLAVITKERDSLGEVFALDGLAPGTVTTATHLGTLRTPGNVDFRTTSAALHPSGQRLLLRTYTRVWEVRRSGATRLEELIRSPVVEVPSPSQAQSEAITWLTDGHSYLLGSEFAGQILYRVDCR
ncbi:hypothetical protein [Vitiosangium sp. GDMCC 1.1324]|uniref:hypothetical protein n=1 Tax=Vitiosangium sp. (strain GDMCC 1.1324) TaxID=2138576 RepID=UPI000D3DA830|nr:hypothetical protein [Vitiosangium sp. GDMCC 1.1324]PTL75671.1 hypothetical protein DAT35_53620 [Vitiosangium sp. GDMCC 1.1324]